MKTPAKWMNEPRTRWLLHFIWMRDPYSLHKDDPLVPYFQYKIGPYQPDYFLYFPQEPNNFALITEIFSKMHEYEGYALVRYIEFHYHAYPRKEEFVRFLRYEALRQQRDIRKQRVLFWIRYPRLKAILATVLLWTEEEGRRLESLAQGVDAPGTGEKAEDTGKNVLDMWQAGKEMLLGGLEEQLSGMMSTHLGKIDLYNELHLTRFMQLLYVLQNLRSSTAKNAAPLFKSCIDTDLAAVLRQLTEFGDKKVNTIQGKITAMKRETDLNDPALQKLEKALRDFFFSKSSEPTLTQ